ncbi:hypothetical protein FQA39_LY04928 [Lamprigera yunnana]|nr:hypothetical protein FQA39_LY04928 [Lamprigera yunnana]
MPRTVGDNAIPAFRFYRSAQPRFPLEALSEAASALNSDNSDIENDVAETTFADIGDCDLRVPEEEDEENEAEDEGNVENKISYSEIEASGNSRRTNKAISNLKCKKNLRQKLPSLLLGMNKRSLTFQQVENMTFDKAEAFAIIEEIPSDDESVDQNEDDESEDERFVLDVVVEDEEAFA